MSADPFYTCGPPRALCLEVTPGTFWFQTTDPEYSRNATSGSAFPPFLDWGGDDHLALLVAEVTKVRVPRGEGDTLNKALENSQNLQTLICQRYRATRTHERLCANSRHFTLRCRVFAGETYTSSATVTPRMLAMSLHPYLHTRLPSLLTASG